MPHWAKGAIYSSIAWVAAMLIWSIGFMVAMKGKCSIVPGFNEGSFLACFMAPVGYGLVGILPIVILGTLLGWVYGKTKSK